MANRFIKRLFHDLYYTNLIKRQETYRRFVYGFLSRCQSQISKPDMEEADALKETKNAAQVSSKPQLKKKTDSKSGLGKYCSSDDLSDNKWRLELAWLTKALEPALQLWNGLGSKTPPSGRSLTEIITSIQRSKSGIECDEPGYYIGIDPRKKLIILGIRGTHTVYDLITDIVSSSDGEVTFEGYSTHFGTAEAARWFLNHEMGTIRKCLEKYEGFRLRLVGHSLGAAIASLLAIMLRKRSYEELGFSPDIVSAIGFATPPCVSRELAESCADFVTTVVMQDDIVPRLSVASLARLRNEILQTDWMSVIEKEDWRSVIGLVTNAKQVVSSVQDVAWKLADYAKFRSNKNSSDGPIYKQSLAASGANSTSKATIVNNSVLKKEGAACMVSEELFVPGTVYYLKRNIDTNASSRNGREVEFFTLWKRHPGEHFQSIVLSSNIISDHKCDGHYYALRDVLKALPVTRDEDIFK
ncbi:hypothetical protein GH714_022857 [Hevea brasiliensis]|uniref:Fungal lipase-type domain-containing protein n=1 Tax=Hevea brasiliensis TaxID=3981 RepID=A0A6A6KCN3_HEVBR|nr:hypothetical protein GH714_022857 [Hevea brasiliensis]